MQKGYFPARAFNSCTFDSSGGVANGSCMISVLCLYGLLLNAAKEGSGKRMGKLAKEFGFMQSFFLVSYLDNATGYYPKTYHLDTPLCKSCFITI
jgi:hypothetical protein